MRNYFYFLDMSWQANFSFIFISSDMSPKPLSESVKQRIYWESPNWKVWFRFQFQHFFKFLIPILIPGKIPWFHSESDSSKNSLISIPIPPIYKKCILSRQFRVGTFLRRNYPKKINYSWIWLGGNISDLPHSNLHFLHPLSVLPLEECIDARSYLSNRSELISC